MPEGDNGVQLKVIRNFDKKRGKRNSNKRCYTNKIRCPETGKVQLMKCGKDGCKWFGKRLMDMVTCHHPKAKEYVNYQEVRIW